MKSSILNQDPHITEALRKLLAGVEEYDDIYTHALAGDVFVSVFSDGVEQPFARIETREVLGAIRQCSLVEIKNDLPYSAGVVNTSLSQVGLLMLAQAIYDEMREESRFESEREAIKEALIEASQPYDMQELEVVSCPGDEWDVTLMLNGWTLASIRLKERILTILRSGEVGPVIGSEIDPTDISANTLGDMLDEIVDELNQRVEANAE